MKKKTYVVPKYHLCYLCCVQGCTPLSYSLKFTPMKVKWGMRMGQKCCQNCLFERLIIRMWSRCGQVQGREKGVAGDGDLLQFNDREMMESGVVNF